MYVLKKEQTFKMPVTLSLPVNEEIMPVEISVTFKLPKQSVVNDTLKEQGINDLKVCKRFVVDIDGIQLENGEKASIDDVLETPKTAAAIALEFFKTVGVIVEKN